MFKALLCAALIGVAFSVKAAEAAPDASARADIKCYPVADIKSFIAGAGGRLVELAPEQFQFARGLFVGSPPVSSQLPPGDHALMGVVGERVGVFFIEGDMACDAGVLPPALSQMLRDVGAGRVNHIGDGA